MCEKEDFRGFLERLRKEGTHRHPAAGGHPPHRDAGRPVRPGALFHDIIGYDMPVVSGIIHARAGAQFFRDQFRLQQGIDHDPPKYVENAPPREVIGWMKWTSTPAIDVLDLRRRPDDHRRRGVAKDRGTASTPACASWSRKEPDRHRHRDAEQHAPLRAAQQAGRLPDLDFHRHPPVRDHGLGFPRRHGRDGHCRRHPRRAGAADSVRDDRHAVHRRRRDRARGQISPADASRDASANSRA